MSMHTEYVKQGAATTRRISAKNPMQVVAALRARHPTADFMEIFEMYFVKVEKDMDLCRASHLQACRNFCTALEQDERRAKSKRAPERATQEQQFQQTVQRFNQFVYTEMLMPNGKPALDCTGKELCKFGRGWDRVGRKIGSKTLRASGLGEAQVRAIMNGGK